MGLTRKFWVALGLLTTVTSVLADPLSTSKRIDFYREISSRNLHGMATRSDGRLLAGPEVRALKADLGTDLLWSLSVDENELLIGTGPEGKLLAVDLTDPAAPKTKVVLELPGTHLFSVARLPKDNLLVGTSPDGALVLAQQGKILSRVKLPVTSILDIKLVGTDATKPTAALVATGSHGQIYRVDLAKFAKAGVDPDIDLAAAGIALWGAVRDDNVRRLLVLNDGTVIAGSAPKGNVYQFPAEGGAPILLDENNHAEVTALLPWDGGFFAAITFTNETRETRVKQANNNQPANHDDDNKPKEGSENSTVVVAPTTPIVTFRGRSQLIWYPTGGFPEVVATRMNTAFYDLASHEGNVLIAGGEEGELLGYNPEQQRSYTFAGATASQVNAIIPAGASSGKFYLLGNNPGTLELLDFNDRGTATAETGRLDLNVMSTVGAVRFERPVPIPAELVKVELRASFGSDELEGWTAWQTAGYRDGGWSVAGLRGRYVQLRITAQDAAAEFARATLFSLPQNRRPQLQNFQILSPNFALLPAPARADRAATSLAQILQANGKSEVKSRDAFLNSEVTPQPGTQVAFWSVNDADGDNTTATFSIRAADATEWTDVLVNSPEDYAQFEISHLAEGIYRTRLTISETSPRPLDQRLATSIETDDLMIDRTPPQILDVSAIKQGNGCMITVHARDALSLLRGVELKFNNGASFDLEQPVDGILDGQEETFALELTGQQLDGSTSVEAAVLDEAGNSSARRIFLPVK
jgi:hypothetical protein|uniref:hypothetical protein n=2 Tax=Cephaloticoccus sp. TaxID=1985742 RepID=UPI00404B1269